MAKKKKRNRNPLLQKRWHEGYNEGLKDGIARSVSFFAERFEGLDDIPGIGEKNNEED